MHRLLLLLLRHPTRLLLTQPPPNRSGLLRAQIKRQVFFVLVVYTELGTLVGVNNSKNAGDGFADVVAAPENELLVLLSEKIVVRKECARGWYKGGYSIHLGKF